MEKNIIQKYNIPIKRYKFWFSKRQYQWSLHVRSVFKKYSWALVNKSRKKRHAKLRRRRRGFFFRLNLRQAKNNFYTTYYTKKHKVLWTFSCGSMGLRGPRRSTVFAAQQLGRKTAKKLSRNKFKKTFLLLKSPLTSHMRGCLSNLGKPKTIGAILDLLPRPHNGLRKRKLRRL